VLGVEHRSPGRAKAGALLVLCLLSAACSRYRTDDAEPAERAPIVQPAPVPLGPRPLVGAHYYHWYPGNWAVGTLRGTLDPHQPPELGWYDSTDVSVAEQHIAWASEHGIDFFTLDSWPVHHQENQAAIARFLEAPNIADIAFTIFYETWDLSFDPTRGYADLDAPGARAAFVEDMAQLADQYFDHPSYLRIDGRPVVILYLTRVLVGDVTGAMAEVRAMWRARGYDPYVVGDEMFWRVTRSDGPAAFTSEPQPDRIRLFDAITAYNPYESSETSHAGYSATSQLLTDVVGLYQRYSDATGGDVPIVPDVLPGYNDRGVRPSLDHYVVPRARAPDAAEGTFLSDMLDQVADPWLDLRAPMVMVTSWNEWNEDTAIEPLRASGPTKADTAADGISRTQGHPYEGFGTRYLEILRDHYVAVSGRVTRPGGSAVVGLRVTASRDGVLLAEDTTDHAGHYTLARAHVGAGPVVVTVGRQAPRPVTVDPEHTLAVDVEVG
jgi:hypothetical protein